MWKSLSLKSVREIELEAKIQEMQEKLDRAQERLVQAKNATHSSPSRAAPVSHKGYLFRWLVSKSVILKQYVGNGSAT
jgi:hypothetical protein